MTAGAHPLHTDAGEPLSFDVPDPFLYEPAVREADIDGQGHVNNAVYVRWMDAAAYAHSAAVGYDGDAYRALGTAFVVRRHEIDYLAPTWPGDRVVVATWPERMARFKAMRRHQVVRVGDGQTLVRAVTTWVYVDRATGRPQRIPAELIAAFGPRP